MAFLRSSEEDVYFRNDSMNWKGVSRCWLKVMGRIGTHVSSIEKKRKGNPEWKRSEYLYLRNFLPCARPR